MRSLAKTAQRKIIPPVYSIESFRTRPHTVEHFDIMRIEKDVHEIGYSLKPHRHTCYLILIITKGSGTHRIDGENFKVEPNVIFLLSHGQIHSFEFSHDISGFAVYFTLDFYLNYARERHFDKIPFFRSLLPQTYVKTHEENMKFINVLLEEMLCEYTQNLKAKEEALRNFLDILLIRLNRLWKHDYLIKGKVTSVVQIRKLMQLVEEHYKQGMTARDYAKLMSLTPNHLNTLCKESISLTVTELLHDRTILEAKRLLAYSDWTVKKIANDIGFKDSAYFLRLFKKKTGMTPDKFRSASAIT